MKRLSLLMACLLICCATLMAQQRLEQRNADGTFSPVGTDGRQDSVPKSDGKTVPQGIHVWTVDERFGDQKPAVVDTLQHMFMNHAYMSGLRGEYNTTGNLGAPRQNRIFVDRPISAQFPFTQPYDYFNTQPSEFHFTNTLSPITNLTYEECGDKNNGEDHLRALFAVNAGKQLGVGFKFDYLYGRGSFQEQNTAHFNYSLYGSYLGDRYQAHLLLSTNHQKVTENGGIGNDNYVTHPEIYDDDFRDDEIPTVLSSNWNRNDNQHVFLTHRYSVGFNRKVPMNEEEIKARKFAIEAKKEEEQRKNKGRQPAFEGRPDDAKIAGDEPANPQQPADNNRIAVSGKQMADSLIAADKKAAEDTAWVKNEYVPVTSFIHTLKLDNYKRVYQAYETPADFYLNSYDLTEKYGNDSIYDRFRHTNMVNTLAISLLEGFNKWVPAGLKGFVASDLRHFEMPDTVAFGSSSFNEHSLSVGGQLIRTQGSLLHYSAMLETWVLGEDAGQLKFDASADVNFRFLGDTVRLAARGYIYRLQPTFFHRKYQSRHLWWNNDRLEKETRTRLEGLFSYEKTNTRLRVAFDNIKNYTYLSQQYSVGEDYRRTGNTVQVMQCPDAISLLTLQLSQDFHLGPLNWETQLTYQKSSDNKVLPVPDFNVYSNLYFNFRIAKVLRMHLGADVRYFTKYEAPDYCPYVGQFCVQGNGDNNLEIGNYPIVNVYVNMHLKRTRFYVAMSHVNQGDGGNRFLVPHYPLRGRTLRLGVSWNFIN